MKKNILTENMLRFGTKNLSESQKSKLTEQLTREKVEAHFKHPDALSELYFEKNPTGTMTFQPNEYNPILLTVNGSSNLIKRPSGTPDFKDVWRANGTDFGRGFRSGKTGEYTYQYNTQLKKIELLPTKKNRKSTCRPGGCFYISKRDYYERKLQRRNQN